jgi:hypothetical protein
MLDREGYCVSADAVMPRPGASRTSMLDISSILLVRVFPHVRCYFGSPHFSLNIIFWTTKVDLLLTIDSY